MRIISYIALTFILCWSAYGAIWLIGRAVDNVHQQAEIIGQTGAAR